MSALPSATYAGPNENLWLPASGDVIIPDNLAVSGTLSVAGGTFLAGVQCAGLTSTGNVALTGTASLNVAGGITCPGVVSLGATSVTALASSGNVALTGTASLDVAGGIIAGTSVTTPSVNATSELIGNLATLAQLQGAFLDQTQGMVFGSVFGATSIKLGRLKIVFGTAPLTDSQVALGSCSFTAGTTPCVIAFGYYAGAGNGYYVNCVGAGSTGSMATSLAFHGTSQSGSGFGTAVSFIAWAYQ